MDNATDTPDVTARRRTVTLSSDLVSELRGLPDDALKDAIAATWAARDWLEDVGGYGRDDDDPPGVVDLLGDLLGCLDDEAERRRDMLADARIAVDWNGHLVGPYASADCTCGWRAERDGSDLTPKLLAHARENGGRSLVLEDGSIDVPLFKELYPSIYPDRI